MVTSRPQLILSLLSRLQASLHSRASHWWNEDAAGGECPFCTWLYSIFPTSQPTSQDAFRSSCQNSVLLSLPGRWYLLGANCSSRPDCSSWWACTIPTADHTHTEVFGTNFINSSKIITLSNSYHFRMILASSLRGNLMIGCSGNCIDNGFRTVSLVQKQSFWSDIRITTPTLRGEPVLQW